MTTPIACTLSADDHRCCADELFPALAMQARAVVALDERVRLEFDAAPGIVTRIASVVERERSCCQFLHFVLEVSPERGDVVLSVRGPAGTADFLASLSAMFSPRSNAQ